jgi:hypothetical protein
VPFQYPLRPLDPSITYNNNPAHTGFDNSAIELPFLGFLGQYGFAFAVYKIQPFDLNDLKG